MIDVNKLAGTEMSSKRTKHDPPLKAKAALEAIEGEKCRAYLVLETTMRSTAALQQPILTQAPFAVHHQLHFASLSEC